MSIEAVWLNEPQRIVHIRYGGDLATADYIEAIQTLSTMMQDVSNSVHFVLERTAVVRIQQSPLSILLFANRQLPQNVGVVVIIQPTTYIRMILSIARSLTPRLVKNLHYATDMTTALQIIQQGDSPSATGESDE